MSQNAASAAFRPRAELPAVIATVCGFAFSAGLLYPTIALMLERRGVSEDMIGLNTAMVGLGVIVSAFFLPRLTERFGGWAMLFVGAVGAILVLGAMSLGYDYWRWLALRFLLGVFINGLYVIGEAWVNAIAGDEKRGRTIALYTTVMGAAFAAGPALAPVVGTEDMTAFYLVMAVVAASVAPMLGFRRIDPLRGQTGLGKPSEARFGPIWRGGAVMLGAVFAFGLLDGTTLGLTPIWALGLGLEGDAAALPLIALVVGAVGFQYPVGWLADRFGPRQVLPACAAVCAGGGLLLPLLPVAGILFYATLAVWGGASFALFTVSLMLIGRRFQGPALSAASALLTMMWGLGAVIGPWGVGVAMRAAGPHAMPLTLALVCLVLFAATLAFRGLLPTKAEARATARSSDQ
ncbi:MAG: MFS transporter [Alphaproteobacteria bacterium]|nr:MFS transporter [Alphaproteobacteria bacterium]